MDSYSLLYYSITDCLTMIGINGNDIVETEIHNTLFNLYNYFFNDFVGFGYYGEEKKNKLNENLFFFIFSFISSIFVIIIIKK